MFVVAGATGRTGRLAAEGLLAHGQAVRVIVRDPAAREAWLAAGAEAVVASLDDATALTRALAGARGFYALLPENIGVPDFRGQRARMAHAIAAAVASSGVAHVVLLSAAAASLASGNGPARELHLLENALRAGGARVSAIRAASFQENVLGLRTLAAREGIYPSLFAATDLAFPTVATADVARLAVRCLLEPPPASEIIDLVGPAYSVRQLSDRLGVALGKALRVVVVPREAHLAALEQSGLGREHAEAVAELFACLASGRVVPEGDRMVAGTTALPEVLAAVRS